jgi:pectate lyase
VLIPSGSSGGCSRILLFILFACLLSVPVAHGQLFVDHFSYPNGNLGADGIGNLTWDGGDSPNTPIRVNTAAALSHASLADVGGSGVIFTGSTFKKKAAPFASQSANAVYCSFLLNIQSPPTGTKAFVYLHNSSSGTSSPGLGIFLDSTSHLGLGKNASSPTASIASPLSAGTHLVVARYVFQAGNDRVDLWLDPLSLGDNSAIPAPSLTTGTASSSEAASLSYLFLNHAVVQTLWIDEVRVGTSWAEVTPSIGTPVLPTLAPYITQAFLTGDSFALLGTNGPANGSYDLLTTTNPALPMSQWIEIASDTFDSYGNFSSTNPISPAATRQFYRVRVSSFTPPPEGPAITTQPQSRTNLAGDTATFTVVASGTAPLVYRWYFNTNTLLGGATGATLTLNNVQPANEGSYSVVISNSVNSVTSQFATLTVSNILAAPAITTQPQSQTVTEGQTVNFSVLATGTLPLHYQWYFNTNTPLTDQTNSALVLNNVSTNDAGSYSVTVTNSLGPIDSDFALLTVNPPSTNHPDFSHVGFGNAGFTVTGGAGGPVVTVTNGAQLNEFTDANGPYVIYVSGTLQISGMSTHVRPNKTVIGLGTNAVLEGGGLYLYRSTNVIIRNLTIRNSTEDNIGLHYSDHVWIDHCTIVDSQDGGIDLTQESDYTTISWCKFLYTVNHGHDFVNLMGASDGESGSIGKLHVTFHHNWWGANCIERMPSVRFGRAHVYNNYYNAPGNGYCVRSRLYAECRIENNWFENVKNPWEVYLTSGPPGLIYAAGNAFTNVVWTTMYPAADPVFTAPYSYSLDPAAAVPALVIGHAGAGQGPFAP